MLGFKFFAVDSRLRGWLRPTGVALATAFFLPKCPLCWMALTSSLAAVNLLPRSVSSIAAVLIGYAVFQFVCYRVPSLRWASALPVVVLARTHGIPWKPAVLVLALLVAVLTIYAVPAARSANHPCCDKI